MLPTRQIQYILNAVNLVVSLMLLVVGFRSIVNSNSFQGGILGFYILLFAGASILLEIVDFEAVRKYFLFYSHALGRGAFYLLYAHHVSTYRCSFGCLVVGGNTLQLVTGVFAILLAAAYVALRITGTIKVVPAILHKEEQRRPVAKPAIPPEEQIQNSNTNTEGEV